MSINYKKILYRTCDFFQIFGYAVADFTALHEVCYKNKNKRYENINKQN